LVLGFSGGGVRHGRVGVMIVTETTSGTSKGTFSTMKEKKEVV